MRILDRYLVKGFGLATLYCTALFSVLFVVIDSFNNLDEFLKHSAGLKIIVSYYAYLLPSALVQIIPVAVLVATLYALSHLNKHNEVIAMKASGISAFHILSPYLFMGLLISFGLFLFNETVVPQAALTSTAIMDGLIIKGKKNLQERAIKNVTLRSSNGRIIFARELEVLNQNLHDVVVLEENTGQTVKSKLVAKKAHYENGVWVFSNAMKYRLNNRGDMIGDPEFSQKLVVEMPERPDDFIKEASQIEFMNARQLKQYIRDMQGSSRRLLRRLRVDFHYKIAFPFISFVVILIGAPLAMRMERGGTMVGAGTGLLLVLSYYGVESICLALGKGGYLPPLMAAWFANVLFASTGIYWIKNTT